MQDIYIYIYMMKYFLKITLWLLEVDASLLQNRGIFLELYAGYILQEHCL